MNQRHYLLDKNRNPVPCTFEKFIDANRDDVITRVAITDLPSSDVMISTVFLGMDHRLGDVGERPVLFETMIFGGKFDDYQQRSCTWQEAEEQHIAAVVLAMEGATPKRPSDDA